MNTVMFHRSLLHPRVWQLEAEQSKCNNFINKVLQTKPSVLVKIPRHLFLLLLLLTPTPLITTPFYGACCIENRFVKALNCYAFLIEYNTF